MVKKHMKSVAMPRSWPLQRKARGRKYVTRPMPGAHAFERGMAINQFIRMLGYAETNKEIKRVIREKEVIVDGKRVTDPKKSVGLMDLLEFPGLKKKFRVVIDVKGSLKLLETDESAKPCKITGKRTIRNGKFQLSLHDGRNILTGKTDYKTGDVLVLKVPGQEIIECFRLEKGSAVYLVDGSHKGMTGIVEEISNEKLKLKIGPDLVETQKRFAFPIGKGKPAIKLMENSEKKD